MGAAHGIDAGYNSDPIYIRTLFHGEGIRTLKSGLALIKNIIALFEDEGPGLQITMLYISRLLDGCETRAMMAEQKSGK